MEFLAYEVKGTQVTVKRSERRILAWLWRDYRPTPGFMVALRVFLAVRGERVRPLNYRRQSDSRPNMTNKRESELRQEGFR